MTDRQAGNGRQDRHEQRDRAFQDRVDRSVRRAVRAKRERDRTFWFGLGTFGIVGWSVAIPTLAGIAAGLWLDQRFPGRVSWTLSGLFVGVVLGSLNAWYWVQRMGGRRR